ncbi:helix-turn-helix transcriptional regulator [Mycobacterium colombiense]
MTSAQASGDYWLTRVELAERLRVPLRTPGVWASKGFGPKYHRFGRHCRYRLSDVIAWENAQYTGGAHVPTGGGATPAEMNETAANAD